MEKSLFLLLLLFLLSCGENFRVNEAKQDTKKEEVTKLPVQPYEIVADLNNELVFKFMNKHEEPLGLYEDDNQKKATCSMVQVYEFDPADMLHVQTKNRCAARIVNDTLHISLSETYAGVGLTLQVKDGKYTIHPYTDFAPDLVIIDENEKPSKIELQRAKLILDKLSYEVGDSIFGHLYFRALIDSTAKHYAQGYFRAKIERE